MTAYAELQTLTNFTFLQGASHPQELAMAAAALGISAFAVTDRNTLAGVVRAHAAAKELGVRFIVGARLDLQDAPSLLAYPTDRAAYGRLSRLLTIGRRRAPKGECHLTLDDVMAHGAGQIFIALSPEENAAKLEGTLPALAAAFPRRVYLAAHCLYRGDDGRRLAQLAGIASRCGAPLVATNDVHYHEPARRPLQDVLTCIREHCTIDNAGWRLAANAERHMKPPEEMARLFAEYPDAIARTLEIAEACRFSLEELRYEYPDELTARGPHAAGGAGDADLGRRALALFPAVAGQGPHHHRARAEADRARSATRPISSPCTTSCAIARSQDILCQGRGSAANSVVCYLPGHHLRGSDARSICCSSASSAPSATSRPISTSISSMSGARR